ncbi:MAG: tetratricopeptide repeat protein [Nitrospinota bacterium]
MMLFVGTRQERLISLSTFVYAFSVVIFFVSSRLRLPVSLFLILSSGFTIKQLFLTRNFRNVSFALLLFIPAALLTFKERGGEMAEVTKSNFHTYTQLAHKNKKTGNYNEALHFFNLAVAERPENILLLADAGDMALKAKNLPLARQYFKKILILTKNFPPEQTSRGPFNWSNPAQMSVYRAMYQLGILYYRDQRLAEAASFLTAATNRFPPGLEAQKFLARAYAASGKKEHAITLLDRYMKQYPNPVIRQELKNLKNLKEEKPSLRALETGEKIFMLFRHYGHFFGGKWLFSIFVHYCFKYFSLLKTEKKP